MCVSLASFDVFRKIFSLLQLYQNKLGAGKWICFWKLDGVNTRKPGKFFLAPKIPTKIRIMFNEKVALKNAFSEKFLMTKFHLVEEIIDGLETPY